MVVAFVVSAPNFNVAALTLGFVAGAIVMPLLATPFSNTLWMAVDLIAHKPDAQELAAAAAAVEPAVDD